jgi:hypothetical protein
MTAVAGGLASFDPKGGAQLAGDETAKGQDERQGKACMRLSLLQDEIMGKPLLSLAAAAVLSTLAACASTPPPTEQLAAARAMVSQAQPLAAREAPTELQTAQAKLARAEDAMQRGDYVNARIFAEQADVDAKYALTLAENARTQRAVAEIQSSLSTLREELERRPR